MGGFFLQAAFRLGGALLLLVLMGDLSPLFACDEPAVSIGQTKEEVKIKCGAPIWTEKRRESLRVEKRPQGRRRSSQTIEEWYYNPGPQALVRILQFENGRLARIDTGGYGWTENGPVDFGCERTVLPSGTSKVEVRGRCGKPTSIHKKEDPYETWRYNLGSSRFVRIFQFQGGRLVHIQTGEYGR